MDAVFPCSFCHIELHLPASLKAFPGDIVVCPVCSKDITVPPTTISIRHRPTSMERRFMGESSTKKASDKSIPIPPAVESARKPLWYYCQSPQPDNWIPSLWNADSFLNGLFFFGHAACFISCWIPSIKSNMIVVWPTIFILHVLYVLYFLVLETLCPSLRIKKMIKNSQPTCPACEPDSNAERNILEALSAQGFEHSFQQKQSSNSDSKYCYRTDISVIRPLYGLRIDVEIDGDFKRDDSDMQAKIDRRNTWFISNGWHVVRFYASDCYRYANDIADDIISLTAQKCYEHDIILKKRFGNAWKECQQWGAAYVAQGAPSADP